MTSTAAHIHATRVTSLPERLAERRIPVENPYTDDEADFDLRQEERQPFLVRYLWPKDEDERLPLFRRRSGRFLLVGLLVLLTILVEILLSIRDDSSVPLPGEEQERDQHHHEPVKNLLNIYTPYKHPLPEITSQSTNDTCASDEQDPGRVPDMCKLVHLQLFARHGTDHPKEATIRAWKKLEKKLHLINDPEWPDWLREWRNPLALAQANELTEQGKRDMQQLAHRDICRYKNAMIKHGKHGKHGKHNDHPRSTANKRDINVRRNLLEYTSANAPRCMASALAYASVFSGEEIDKNDISVAPLGQDYKLDALYTCPAWLTRWNALNADSTVAKLPVKQYYPSIHQQLSDYLGYDVTYADGRNMARLCINDYVTYNRTNQWCELLEAFPSELDDVDSEEVPYDDAPGAYGPDPNIMELSDYVGDVLTYRRVGAGHRDNRCYGTMAMYELVSNMRRAILGQLKRPWQLSFTQHYTIIMLLTFMGLYDETPTFNRHRLFRMSQLIPFAANLHFEVLACVDEEEADEEDPGYFVRVLLNERPIQIPGCPRDGPLCPWSKFYSVMQRNLSKCDFEEICSH